MVLFDQGTYDKLLSEAPKFKLITPSILSDRLRVFFFSSCTFVSCFVDLFLLMRYCMCWRCYDECFVL